jgi:hypothetical protein
VTKWVSGGRLNVVPTLNSPGAFILCWCRRLYWVRGDERSEEQWAKGTRM